MVPLIQLRPCADDEVALRVDEALSVVSAVDTGITDASEAASERLEDAHNRTFRAERQASRLHRPGIATAAGAAAAGSLLVVAAPVLAPAAFGVAACAYGSMVLWPGRRLRVSTREEQALLDELGAPSWLGFHIRRVESSLEPQARRVSSARYRRARST